MLGRTRHKIRILSQDTPWVRSGTHTSTYISCFPNLPYTFTASNLPPWESQFLEPIVSLRGNSSRVFTLSLLCSTRRVHVSYAPRGRVMFLICRKTGPCFLCSTRRIPVRRQCHFWNFLCPRGPVALWGTDYIPSCSSSLSWSSHLHPLVGSRKSLQMSHDVKPIFIAPLGTLDLIRSKRVNLDKKDSTPKVLRFLCFKHVPWQDAWDLFFKVWYLSRGPFQNVLWIVAWWLERWAKFASWSLGFMASAEYNSKRSSLSWLRVTWYRLLELNRCL